MHADSRPPADLASCVRSALSRRRIVLGGFRTDLVLDDLQQTPMRLVSLHQLAKTYYVPALFRPLSFLRGIRLLFGDQVRHYERAPPPASCCRGVAFAGRPAWVLTTL